MYCTCEGVDEKSRLWLGGESVPERSGHPIGGEAF